MFFLIQISKFCKMMQVSVLWYLSRLSFKSPVSAFPKLLQNTLGEAVNIKYLDNWHDCLCIHYSGLCSSSIKDKFLQFSPFLLNIFCCHRVFQRCFLTGKKVFAKFLSNTNDIDAAVITCWVWSHIKKENTSSKLISEKVLRKHLMNHKERKNLPRPWLGFTVWLLETGYLHVEEN